MLCAAMLHDTVEDTPLTMPALRRAFGIEVAALVAGVTALDRLAARQTADVLAAIGSADNRVVLLKMADRLHNMRTLEFLPSPKQLVKAREVLDIFAPAAEELSLPAIGSELQALAFATLIRNQTARLPSYRTIVALDIERSTSRTDLVKAELRVMLYELFEAALRAAGIHPDDCDPFLDRGDGLLALIHPTGPAPAGLVFTQAVPVLERLLTGYNASCPPERQLRVRAVVHAGQVRYDGHGCYGEALDTACRLLDAPEAKQALRDAPGPLILVTSDRLGFGAGARQLRVLVGDEHRAGHLFFPA